MAILSILTMSVYAATGQDIDLSKSYTKTIGDGRMECKYDIGSYFPYDDVRVATVVWADPNAGTTEDGGWAAAYIEAINGNYDYEYTDVWNNFDGLIDTGWVEIPSVDYAQTLEHEGGVFDINNNVIFDAYFQYY